MRYAADGCTVYIDRHAKLDVINRQWHRTNTVARPIAFLIISGVAIINRAQARVIGTGFIACVLMSGGLSVGLSGASRKNG